MVQITINGFPVEPGTSYINTREAEKAAARKFNDPPRRAPACPSIPRKTWREAGYSIQDVPERVDVNLLPAAGHVCPQSAPFCFPERPRPRWPGYDVRCGWRTTAARIATGIFSDPNAREAVDTLFDAEPAEPNLDWETEEYGA